jgi:hypothetical protein
VCVGDDAVTKERKEIELERCFGHFDLVQRRERCAAVQRKARRVKSRQVTRSEGFSDSSTAK